MRYTININYDTGDSFTHQSGVEQTIDLEWDDLELAKQNLQFIKEHYDLYKLSRAYGKAAEYEEKLKEAETKEWYKKSEYTTLGLQLKADNGNYMGLYVFWCGYFETLNYVEIIPAKSELDKSTNTKIYF